MTTSYDDPCRELADAIGLKSSDSVLFVGVGQRLGDFKEFASSVKFVRTGPEVKKLIVEDVRFDKVVVGFGNLLDCAQLVNDGGLLAHLNQNQDEEEEMDRLFHRFIDGNYLNARTWATRVGGDLTNITDARGLPLAATRGRI
jgi:hypothetical protein